MSVSTHASNGDGCILTQYTIVKGGTSCLFGTCQGATNWSALTADFLLVNLLASPRYSHVIFLNFDRQDMGSCTSKLVANWNKNKSMMSSSNNVIGGNWPKKLCSMQNLILDSESGSPFDDILEDFKRLLKNTIDHTIPAGPTSSVAAPKNVALVLYSISELVLNVGFRATRDFLRTLTDLLQEHISPTSAATSTSSSAATLVPCVILVVHESLHSPAALAQIQSLASVIVRVVPNSGTLASTVVAEIQTIRRYDNSNTTVLFSKNISQMSPFYFAFRSAATGKINESTEMFTCRDSLLAPLKPVSSFADDADDAAESDSAKDITALPTAEGSSNADKEKERAGVAKSSAAGGGAAKASASHNQRLITFDSTDPEFDEDSDPDADLDL